MGANKLQAMEDEQEPEQEEEAPVTAMYVTVTLTNGGQLAELIPEELNTTCAAATPARARTNQANKTTRQQREPRKKAPLPTSTQTQKTGYARSGEMDTNTHTRTEQAGTKYYPQTIHTTQKHWITHPNRPTYSALTSKPIFSPHDSCASRWGLGGPRRRHGLRHGTRRPRGPFLVEHT